MTKNQYYNTSGWITAGIAWYCFAEVKGVKELCQPSYLGKLPPQLHSREPPQLDIPMKEVAGARQLFVRITVYMGRFFANVVNDTVLRLL